MEYTHEPSQFHGERSITMMKPDNPIIDSQVLTNTLIENICSRLAQYNWSLKMLADQSDLPYESVKKLINRKIQKPSFYSVWQIANALGCTVDQLAGGTQAEKNIERQAANTREIFRILADLQTLLKIRD